jgi:hypothetical protein
MYEVGLSLPPARGYRRRASRPNHYCYVCAWRFRRHYPNA